MTTARDELPEASQAAPAVGIRLDRTVRRLVARHEIVGPEWTFAKGRHLMGRRDGPESWAVWPRRDPVSFLVGVSDELVREVTVSQALREAGFSRRPSAKSLPSDE